MSERILSKEMTAQDRAMKGTIYALILSALKDEEVDMCPTFKELADTIYSLVRSKYGSITPERLQLSPSGPSTTNTFLERESVAGAGRHSDEMSELPTVTDDGAKRLQAAIDEDMRLAGLTNQQLVAECVKSRIGDAVTSAEWDLIAEMMTRLDPRWTDLTPEEEAEEAKRRAGQVRDTPEPTAATPEHRTPLGEPGLGE